MFFSVYQLQVLILLWRLKRMSRIMNNDPLHRIQANNYSEVRLDELEHL